MSYAQGFFGANGGGELKLDEWHVAALRAGRLEAASTNLTLNLGVRYQYESSVPDKNNIAPRIGVRVGSEPQRSDGGSWRLWRVSQ